MISRLHHNVSPVGFQFFFFFYKCTLIKCLSSNKIYHHIDTHSVQLHECCGLKCFFLDVWGYISGYCSLVVLWELATTTIRSLETATQTQSIMEWLDRGKQLAHPVFIWPGEGSRCQETNVYPAQRCCRMPVSNRLHFLFLPLLSSFSSVTHPPLHPVLQDTKH